jgi:hypothetical protein
MSVNNDCRLTTAFAYKTGHGFDEDKSDVRRTQATYCFNDHLEQVQ